MRSIAPAVVMLAIGFVVGFLVGGRRAADGGEALSSPPAAIGDATDSVASRPQSETLSLPRAHSEPEPTRRANSVDTQVLPVITKRQVEDVLAEIPIESSRDRDGFVTGRIAFADGTPVPKAVVVMEPNKPWDLYELRNRSTNGRPDEADPALALRNSLRERAWARVNRLQTETGEDGRFRIVGLGRARDYWIFAHAAGADVSANGNAYVWVRNGADVSFLAVKTTPVAFSIRFADGAEATAAIIDDSPQDGSRHGRKLNWSRSKPTVDLQVGERTVNAWCEVGGQEFSSDAIRLSVATAASVVPQIVVVRPRLALSGRVVAATGEVLRDYRVHAASFDGATPPVDEAIRRDGWNAGISERQKEFRFTPVSPSRYVVLVSSAENRALARAIVDVIESSENVSIELPPVLAESCVRVRVFDPDGRPITNAGVVDVSTDEGAVAQGAGEYWLARRDASAAELAGAPAEQNSRRYVRVDAPGFGCRFAEYAPAFDREVVVRFERPASIQVVVRNQQSAEDPPMVRLALRSVPGRGGETSIPESIDYADFHARDGESVCEGLQPGTGTIFVMHSSDRHNGTRLTRNVAFSSGVNRFVFEFPPTFKVAVDAQGFPEGTHFRAMSVAQETNGSAEYDESAAAVHGTVVVFEDVPPGRLRILAQCGVTAFVPIDVVVATDTTVSMSPALPNSIRIDAVDASFEAQGFKAGDFLVGFDAADWTSVDEIKTALLRLGRTTAGVPVRVRRAGREHSFQASERFLYETFAGLCSGEVGSKDTTVDWRLHRR